MNDPGRTHSLPENHPPPVPETFPISDPKLARAIWRHAGRDENRFKQIVDEAFHHWLFCPHTLPPYTRKGGVTEATH